MSVMLSFNALTPSEAERLALLAEECGELVQTVGKILRHGYNPTDEAQMPPRRYDNRADLVKEIGDVMFAILVLQKASDIDERAILDSVEHKAERKFVYLHHQPRELIEAVMQEFVA